MNKIFKYELTVTGEQEIMMPDKARILSVQVQQGKLCMWALVDPCLPERGRKIAIYGTGHEIPKDVTQYIGTVQYHDGYMVFHVFDLG